MPVHLGHDDIKTGTPAFKQHRQGIAAVQVMHL